MKIFVVFNEDNEACAYFASFDGAITYVERSREYAEALQAWEEKHGEEGIPFVRPIHLPEDYYSRSSLTIREFQLRD